MSYEREGYFRYLVKSEDECGLDLGIDAFLKAPPFSPSDCASKIALNESSKFEFEVGANFAYFGKMLQKCLLLLFAK